MTTVVPASLSISLSGEIGGRRVDIAQADGGFRVTWDGDAATLAREPSLEAAIARAHSGPDAVADEPDPFRTAGYTRRAAEFPLDPIPLAGFAAFVGAKGPDALPAAWRHAPNAWCRETWDAIVARSLAMPNSEPEPARALYEAARRGRAGNPDANTLKAYARAHAAIRSAASEGGTGRTEGP